MNVSEIQALMAMHRVFGVLPPAVRRQLAGHCQLRSYAPGQPVLTDSDMPEPLGWLVSGALDLLEPQAGWRLALHPGELFGAVLQAAGPVLEVQAVAREPSQVLVLDSGAVQQAAQAHPALYLLLPGLQPPAPLASSAAAASADHALTGPIDSLIRRQPLVIDQSHSIRSAAQRMAEAGVSSILLTEQGQLAGLVTDRDLRQRVVAAGLDTSRPVADIATRSPVTLQRRQSVFDALLLMARSNIHHVPVMEGDRLLGMVTASDLDQLHSTSALYLTQEIHRQGDLAGLVACSARVGPLQSRLARTDTSAHNTGVVMTSVTDAFTLRLIQLAEQQLGPAPVAYAWVAAGSQARMEQTARTDQDNCLVLSDGYRAPQHGAYFERLARFVCDGLAACGYVHCPGDIMATTDQWRQPRKRWDAYFSEWTHQPEPLALLLACVFFDMRAVHGDGQLLRGLRRDMLQRTQGNPLFLAHMVGNALKQRPPLGLFGQVTASRGGQHPGTVDLKHGGIAPIVDLARIYALAGALEAVNTRARLSDAAALGGEVSAQAARDLGDALECISALRLAHQTRQMAAGVPPDNHVRLDELSSFERGTLKDAFAVVHRLQAVLGQRYQAGRL